MAHHNLLLDNNAVRRFAGTKQRKHLQSNLRITGREFWPTAINVLEAVKSRDPDIRCRQLSALVTLAGESRVLMMPAEALQLVAAAIANDRPNVDLSEPRLLEVMQDPRSVSEDQVHAVREYLMRQEVTFRAAHERGKALLRPILREHGGADRWPTIASFLDEAWSTRARMEDYVRTLWQVWNLPAPVRVDEILAHAAWRLFFDGWGATVYAECIAHPKPRLVEAADLHQLVYLAFGETGLFVSDDVGLQVMGNAILAGRYPMKQVVSSRSIAQ